MNRTRRAFTLLELLLVLGIVVILSAMAYPSLESMYGNYRVTAAVDTVRAAWALGRAQAVNEGQAYRFAVMFNQGDYRLAPDNDSSWGGSAGSSNQASSPNDQGTPPLILEDSLPKGVRFNVSDDTGGNSQAVAPQPVRASSGAWSTVVTFLPDGTASRDVAMVFRATGARPVNLTLRAFTSVVTVRRLP